MTIPMKVRARIVNLMMVAGALGALATFASTGCSSDEAEACGCDDVRGMNGKVPAEVHQSLECACSSSSEPCPKSATEYEARLCARVDAGTMGASVVRRMGCGTVTVGPSADLSGWEVTFDAETGALVGILEFSDINYGSCNAHSYSFGRTTNDCDELEVCTLCGAGTDPPCR